MAITYFPKFLQTIDIGANEDVFGYGLGGARTATLTHATYESILEVLIELQTKLRVVDATFVVAVSYLGIVSITCDNLWTSSWGTTDSNLKSLLGFAAETVQFTGGKYVLTAGKRHDYGFYSPVPVEYPARRYTKPRRVQRADNGDASIISSSTRQADVDLFFDLMLEGQIEPREATTLDDGYGGSIDWTDRTFLDWWDDVSAKKFRFYEHGNEGTVAAPGTEGAEYDTCVRLDTTFQAEQVDSGGYTYFSVRLPLAITGQ